MKTLMLSEFSSWDSCVFLRKLCQVPKNLVQIILPVLCEKKISCGLKVLQDSVEEKRAEQGSYMMWVTQRTLHLEGRILSNLANIAWSLVCVLNLF